MKTILKFFLLFIIVDSYAQVKIVCREVKLATKPLKEVSYEKAIETKIGGKFEAFDIKLRKQRLVSTGLHPVIATLYNAYADHRPISISPDMIWLLICQGFATHVNLNTKELRDTFVSFNNKEKLIVDTQKISNKFIKGSKDTPWSLAFPVMANEIAKHVKRDIHSLYVQTFSTTTPAIKATYEIAMLDCMSGYFNYEYVTSCEIPLIYIEGKTNDWLQIKQNLSKLKGYNIDDWIKVLEPIIDQFIDASKNKIDKDFWENIFKRKDQSGGPYITGWIIKFFPYVYTESKIMIKNPYLNKEPLQFMEGLLTNQFNNGLSQADFVWKYFNSKYNMQFIAGFIGIKQDKNTLTLKPEIGWLVRDKKH